MRRRLKIVLALILGISLVLYVGAAVVVGRIFGRMAVRQFISGTFVGTKARPLTNRTFEPTSARLEWGKYLTEGLVACFWCHSERDPKTRLPLAGKVGAGGNDPDFPRPILTALVFPNITPDRETGTGKWTDGMLARAIREGVGHDGRPLIPLMPYESFRHLSDEDLASIIVYLRSIPRVHNPLPGMRAKFPFSLLVKGIPEPLTSSVPQPDVSTPITRGE